MFVEAQVSSIKKAIGIAVELALEPRPAPPQDVRAVLLRGVCRLFSA